MARPKKKRRLIAAAVVAIVIILIGSIAFFYRAHPPHHETIVKAKPEAPPDLEKLRPSFTAGLEALNKKDSNTAIRQLTSFQFGKRVVEEYRLFHLARAYAQAKNEPAQRVTLARLWSRNPRLVARDEVGASLRALYESTGDFTNAARTLGRVNAIDAAFANGDLALLLDSARRVVIKTPRDPNAANAIAIVSSLTSSPQIHLTPAERLDRAIGFMRDGDPQTALNEMNAIDGLSPELATAAQLNRGLALNQLHQYDASNKLLEPLAGGSYRVAVPAIYFSAKNNRALADSINPIVIKTIMVKQQVGTVKVRAKKGSKKTVTKPKFAKVKKQIQLVDLAKKAKKDDYDRRAIERLKDLLALPIAAEIRVEVLSTLIGLAEAKNQDDYERDLVSKLTKLEPSHDLGLQHFWDKAWAAYARGDYNGAREGLKFIFDTYGSTNVKRQARYWYARAGERIGKKDEAASIYRELTSAPYRDLYVINAEGRGAPKQVDGPNPVKQGHADWRDIAEQSMPQELRLAYELTALADEKDARGEIAQNVNRKNQPYADALSADLFNSDGDLLAMMRTLRRAYPQIGSVAQDSVPPYFLKMYHPMRYQDAIRKSASKNGVDPYLIMGLIHQESYYNPQARSVVGARGLMQLMPATGKEIASRLHSSSDLDNPDVNIRLGTFHFRQLVDLFGGKTQLAVASYNAGQGNVAKWRRAAPSKPMDEFLESIPFPETRNYVKRVTMLQASYRRLNE